MAEFIKVGRQFIAAHEVHGLDVGDGHNVTLHFGNTHRQVGGLDAQLLIQWAESRLWNAAAVKAATGFVEVATKPTSPSGKTKRGNDGAGSGVAVSG